MPVVYESPRQRRSRIGQQIREARLAANLSQAAFAQKLGTSRRHVMRWENGHNLPRRHYRRLIADVTGAAMEDLFGIDDDEEDD